jgi:hypothetical protein
MKQLDLFDIGVEDRGYRPQYRMMDSEPHTYIVQHVAKTGRVYRVYYARRHARHALKEWYSNPSKLILVW